MKVYLSGPITGTNDFMDRFASAEKILVKIGCEVVNPAEINSHLPEGTAWQTYMGESLKLLCGCDAICMLDNWEVSKGARIEHDVAEKMGMFFLSIKKGKESR
jgi:hypothetical protein